MLGKRHVTLNIVTDSAVMLLKEFFHAWYAVALLWAKLGVEEIREP
jgi:hypothetical protein